MLQPADRHPQFDPAQVRVAHFPVTQTLHEAFAEQAARTPAAVAVCCGKRRLTYAELDAKSNRLAWRLRGMGIGPESLVGLALERSPEMIVAVLGILKAGGAYVPLDCAYPKQRIGMILDDARVAALVTQTSILAQLPSQAAPVICLDTDPHVAAAPAGALPAIAAPHNAAYVIYTSGSTGIPKGVVVTHENAMRLFAATDDWFNFDRNDVWTLFHSIAFDFSVWELWGALLYGGRLVVVSWDVSRSPSEFHELLRRERVTVLNQTPSAFRQLIQVDAALPLAHELALRYVVFGGEALELHTLRPWFERHGDQSPQLVNMYGITETTVHVTYRPISALDVEQARGSVIGVPILDLELELLDDQQRPVELGAVGEIYVGGAGVARGYLNRPELTAERFIRHPFSSDPEARLYRSGDLARRLADGDLEYLGRIDDQVKIRGFRIELGDISAALDAHDAVRESVVMAREDEPGEKRLVAYIVPQPGHSLGIAELQHFLRDRLPDYMIPAAVVTLTALPLTTNGKIDRRALPAPDRTNQTAAGETRAPQTALEQVLAVVWGEVLRRDAIGLDDDFFALGGHSLTGFQLVSRLRETLQIELPVRALFDTRTIAGLATLLLSDAARRQQLEDTAALVLQLLELTDEEAEALLADES